MVTPPQEKALHKKASRSQYQLSSSPTSEHSSYQNSVPQYYTQKSSLANYYSSTPSSVAEGTFEAASTQNDSLSSISQEETSLHEDSSSLYTAEEAMEHYGFGLFQVFLLILCGTVWVADAMEIILLSFLMPAVKKEWGLTTVQSSAIGSVGFIGMIFGAYSWGFMADKLGRKLAIASMLLFTLIFGVASSLAPNFWFLLVFRACVGFGVTGSAVAFSLFSEFLPQKSRGVFLLIIEGFWTIGVIFETLLAFVCLYESETYHPFRAVGGWRAFLFFTNVPLFLVLLVVVFMPESHRYLIIRNKKKKVENVYKRVAYWNRKPFLEGTPVCKKVKTGKFTDFFKEGIRNVMFILIVLWICSAFVYFGVVVLTPQYFGIGNKEGSGTDTQRIGLYVETLITSAAELPGLLFSSLLINTVGRKKTLCITYFLTAVGIGLLSLPANRAILTMCAVVTRGMAMGASCTVWVLSTEILPTSLRSSGIGLSSSASRIAGALTPFISSALFEINPLIPVVIYVVVGLVGSLFSILVPYETAGRSLSDTVGEEQNLIHESEGKKAVPSAISLNTEYTNSVYESEIHSL